MKIKQLVFPEKMRVETEEVDILDVPGPGQVLVENRYSLISPGTELAMFTQTHIGFPLPDFRYAKYPFRPGYAAVGRVVLAGDGVEGIAEGDTVFTRGKHASHAVIPAGRSVLKVPEDLPIEHIPFAALAQIAFTSVRLSSIRPGHTVAVFGQGMIGNLAAQLMRLSGARKVIGVDRVPERLAIAKACDIDIQIALDVEQADIRPHIDALTEGAGCQVTVEATGNPEVAVPAIRSAAQMGTVVLLGSPRGGAFIDTYFDLHRPGVSVIGAHGSRQADAARYGDPDPYDLMFEFIASKRIRIAPMHTHTLPPSEADRAFRGLLDETETYLGVLLDMNQW